MSHNIIHIAPLYQWATTLYSTILPMSHHHIICTIIPMSHHIIYHYFTNEPPPHYMHYYSYEPPHYIALLYYINEPQHYIAILHLWATTFLYTVQYSTVQNAISEFCFTILLPNSIYSIGLTYDLSIPAHPHVNRTK